MAIFQQLNREGITVVFVTHEKDIAEHTRRIIRLTDGRIASDLSIPVEDQRIARAIHEPLETPV